MANQSIRGQVVEAASRRPVADVRIEAWILDPARSKLVGTAQTTADGTFTIPVEQGALRDERTEIYFKVLRSNRTLADTRSQVLWTARSSARVILPVPDAKSNDAGFQVAGTVTTELGGPVVGVRVEAWDQQLGGETLLVTGVTGDKGDYSISYDPAALVDKPRADLSVRVLDADKRTELARSAVLYQADPKAAVDFSVPSARVTRPSEYDRLLAAAQPILNGKGIAGLDAKGVEYLANRIRWDARNVAMAAQANRLAATTKIPAAHYYALMRSGLPGDADELHRLPDASVKRTLEVAVKGGVIGAEPSIDQTLKLYRQPSLAALEKYAPTAAVSSLGDVLSLSLDAPKRATFLDAFRATAGRPGELWSALAQRGFDKATIARLQTDGKLGFLTRQNAPLIKRLYDTARIKAPEDLVRAGLYTAEAWKPLIGNDAPAQIGADAYAAGLAAQVNLSYPTLVVAEMVRRGQVAGGEDVAKFLATGNGKHVIGVDPVKRWAGFDALPQQTRDGARRVERLYQMTPSHASMTALQGLKFSSARDIVRVPRHEFLEKHGATFPSTAEAELVYQKAQEIHTTTLNMATMYLAGRSSPNVYVMTGRNQKQPPGWLADVPGTPTLEELLQNMDYCACDACKSVLGPAAYFVELLQFIDVAPPAGKKNPQVVLFGRRPDLQDLLLSCENTNVTVPYIDIVNEILEYYVVKNGSLVDFHGFDMREDSDGADLAADPEHVEAAAYDKTKAEVYPYGLPFDMPLAALRLFMQAWDTTLPDALRVFGTPATTRRELLRLNDAEYRILTDTTFRKLPEFFGEPAGNTLNQLNAVVANGKTFCRRTGIDYEDLVAILRTTFVNAGAPLVPLLTPLQVSLQQLQSWYSGALDNAAFTALLPATLVAADYGGDVLQWLRDHQTRIMGLIILTDVGPDTKECDFATLELRFALPDAAANRLPALAYRKLLRFIRLWKQLGWSIEFTDRVVTTFLGIASDALTDANLDATFTSLVARIANFVALQRRLSLGTAKLGDWLAVWDATQDGAARRDRLAHLLRLGSIDLVHFSEITGIDPLADDVAGDTPSLLRFLDAVDALKATRLKVVDLNYLLRHRDDGGTLTPTVAALLRDCKALRDGLTAITADLGAPPANADLAYARSKMALVYDAAVVDRFIGLVGGTTTYEAPFATVEESLPAKLVAVDPLLGFDPFRKVLTHTGILSTSAALKIAADTLVLADVTVLQTQPELDAYVAAFKVGVQGLADAGTADVHALDVDYHELKVVYDVVAPVADPAAQAAALVEQVLPALLAGLQRILLRATLAALLKLEPLLVDVLTEGPATLHAASDTTANILDDFVALADAITFDASQTYALQLDPPVTDDYILYVGAPTGTTVTLAVVGTPVIPTTAVGPRGEVETAAVVSLTAATLTAATLTIADLPAGATAELCWRTKGMAKATVPGSRIYSDARLAHARTSLLRLQKAALLLRTIPLTPRELHHLAAVDADTAGVLNELDATGAITDADLHAQWTRLAWVQWFSRLKADEPDRDTWAGLLEQPGQQTPGGDLVLAAVAGWPDQDLDDVLAHFGTAAANLSSLHALRKVKDAVDFVVATGQPAADLLAWTIDAPDGALISSIKATLRARLDAASWRTTLQSVNDALRNERRDALVKYILHHRPPKPEIDTADKLYEHFLIDVSMDACMKTSRIRLALSTVQLFVMRCLMNLEPDVAAASIRADQWAWMKRYRVWEANRKIFLYPENWLEPELRDNKSPFFLELESDLLKADITDELAEDAYLSYLKKLDEVARLEIVGSYLEEKQPGDQDDDVLHVFGRTNGTTHQYYYRRFEGGYWLPWEKVGLNIEGDLLFPVVWKRRLFVFWLTLVPKPEGGTPTDTPEDLRTRQWGSDAKLSAEITLVWGEYYQKKWMSPKSSELKAPIRLTGMTTFEPEKIVVAMRTEKPAPDISERLVVSILYMGSPTQIFNVVFTTKNAPPSISTGADQTLLMNVDVFNYLYLWEPQPASVLDSNTLVEPGKTFKVSVAQPAGATSTSLEETLLTKTGQLADGFRVRPLMHPVENQFEAPLFYDDEHSLFYVSPDEHVESIPKYNGYFVDPPARVPDKIKIPPLYERPPIIINPGGPISDVLIKVIDDPLIRVINPSYERAISSNVAFTYGGAAFDARGVVQMGGL